MNGLTSHLALVLEDLSVSVESPPAACLALRVETLEVARCCPLGVRTLENQDLESLSGPVGVSKTQILTAWSRRLREKPGLCLWGFCFLVCFVWPRLASNLLLSRLALNCLLILPALPLWFWDDRHVLPHLFLSMLSWV